MIVKMCDRIKEIAFQILAFPFVCFSSFVIHKFGLDKTDSWPSVDEMIRQREDWQK